MSMSSLFWVVRICIKKEILASTYLTRIRIPSLFVFTAYSVEVACEDMSSCNPQSQSSIAHQCFHVVKKVFVVDFML